MEPGGTLPQTTRTTNAGGMWWNLVEPYLGPRSPRRTWWNPGGTLVEPYLKPLSQNLVEPSWNLTSNHPRPARSPCSWWKLGGTLVEPSWNPRGTLPQGRPEPPRSLSGLRPQSFQLLGKKKKNVPSAMATGPPVLKRFQRLCAARRVWWPARLMPWPKPAAACCAERLRPRPVLRKPRTALR